MKKRKIKITTKDEIKNAIISAYNEINIKNQKGTFLSDFIKMPLCFLFRILMILFVSIGVIIIITIYEMFFNGEIIGFLNSVTAILISSSLWVLSTTFAVYLNELSNEIKEEKNSQYLLTYFSAIASFLALVISGISLFK